MRKTKTLEVLGEYDKTTYEAEEKITFLEAKKRYVDKINEYGELDVDDDSREWVSEALEEIYDAINYLVFLSIKLRLLRDEGIEKKKL